MTAPRPGSADARGAAGEVELVAESSGDAPPEGSWAQAGTRTGLRSRLRFLTDPASTVPVYLGVLIAIAGFVLLGIGWADVAGTLNVGLQLPYLMSAGLPGVALVMVGIVVVSISIRRQDAAERARQMAILTEALHELKDAFES